MKISLFESVPGFGTRALAVTGAFFLLSLASVFAAGDPEAKEAPPQREAVECHVRGGLPNVLAKLRAGGEEKIRIAYFGGSITAAQGWRVKSFKWLQEQYPQAQLEEINAAIGGTGSDLGVFRQEQDVLSHDPDLVFVEFAVNDGGAPRERIHQAMEGIVRQIWKHNPNTDICYVYTVSEPFLADLQAGKLSKSASAMEELADYYQIPSITLGMEAARLEKEGKLIWKAEIPKDAKPAFEDVPMIFSKDGVHPLPETGHMLYQQALERSFAKIDGVGEAGPHVLKEPFRADNWEAAKLVPLSPALLSGNWEKLDPETDNIAKRFANRLPELWKASHPGDAIHCRVKGSIVAVYDLLGPDCGQVTVKVDDEAPKTVPRFDGHCTYHRLNKLHVAADLDPTQVHDVTLALSPEAPDKAKLLFERNLPDLEAHPERYAETNWYAGALMVLGDVVE